MCVFFFWLVSLGWVVGWLLLSEEGAGPILRHSPSVSFGDKVRVKICDGITYSCTSLKRIYSSRWSDDKRKGKERRMKKRWWIYWMGSIKGSSLVKVNNIHGMGYYFTSSLSPNKSFLDVADNNFHHPHPISFRFPFRCCSYQSSVTWDQWCFWSLKMLAWSHCTCAPANTIRLIIFSLHPNHIWTPPFLKTYLLTQLTPSTNKNGLICLYFQSYLEH